jgi:hypothetical protein
MALIHEETTISFTEGSTEWEVIYTPDEDDGETMVEVLRDGGLYQRFDDIPSEVKLKAKHPNKTQAAAIIRLAKKLNK